MNAENAITVIEQPTAVNKYQEDQLDLMKRTICRGASDDEFRMFVNVAERTGLDPFSRQIYAVFRNTKVGNEWKKVMTVQTGIDGYRAIAERTGCYAGSDDPVYDREDGDHPNKATVTIYKVVNGAFRSFSASARWGEYVQTDKDGKPTKFWKQMPYLMLGKVAEALALRKAFPLQLSGVYTNEEMQQADNSAPIIETPVEKPVTAKDRLKAQVGAALNRGNMQDAADDRETLGDAVKSAFDAVEVNENGEEIADPKTIATIKADFAFLKEHSKDKKAIADLESDWLGRAQVTVWDQVGKKKGADIVKALEARKAKLSTVAA